MKQKNNIESIRSRRRSSSSDLPIEDDRERTIRCARGKTQDVMGVRGALFSFLTMDISRERCRP